MNRVNRLNHAASKALRALCPGLAAGLLLAPQPARAQAGQAAAAASAAATAVDVAKPIIAKQLKPKPKPSQLVFEGTFVHGNRAEITLRALHSEMDLRSFPLSPQVADAMQRIIDRGGFQYGDKVAVVYDTSSGVAQQIKGKPSKPL